MLNKPQTSSRSVNGQEVSITTGVMAKQANGSITLKCGNLVLLATAVMSKKPKEGIDFFPLTIEFAEKMYASGKIPGGFFKREARPSTDATLIARLIDRPLRPSFPKGLFNEIQIVVTTLSYDPEVSHEGLAITAASAALSISDIPFNGPVAGVLVGQIDGEFVTNPSISQLESSTLSIVIAGTKDAILMVEAGALEVSEETIIKAIQFGHEAIKEQIALQEELVSTTGKTKVEVVPDPGNPELETAIRGLIGTSVEDNLQSGDKKEIEDFLASLEEKVMTELVDKEADNKSEVKARYNAIKKELIRHTIIQKKIRPDGRRLDEVRPIEIDINVLPSTHGSALFTRGETQSLGVITLGTSDDEKMIDGFQETYRKQFMFHYNFPPFSVGEVGRLFTGRRELGHGALAERALESILPKHDDFPYTIRIVSEIWESNGSSSMASVCSGTLGLMECGVPITAPVSGIAMGLLIDGDDYSILSDIQGLEDHYGDMDFKVAGTPKGITALQLDIKVSGLSEEILTKALQQAKEGRLHILDTMLAVIEKPRETLNPNAPKIEFISINPEKVGVIIGPGGKMIKRIEEESGASVYVTDGDAGKVSISGGSAEVVAKAKDMIVSLVRDIEAGDIFDGKITRITNFGAFVEVTPGKEGLIHISAFSKRRIERLEDLVELGQELKVKVREIDHQKRINLVPVEMFD